MRLVMILALLSASSLLAVDTASGDARVFVSNEADGTVSVIDPVRRVEVAKVEVGPRPRGLGLSPDGSLLYVALGTANEIAAVDTERLTVVKRIAAGSDPETFAVHPGGNLYVSNEDQGTASVLDPDSGERLEVLSLKRPYRSWGTAGSVHGAGLWAASKVVPAPKNESRTGVVSRL